MPLAKSLIALSTSLVVISCGTTQDVIPEWAVPTEYVVKDIDDQTRNSLIDRLQGQFEDLGVEVIADNDAALTFRVDAIPDMNRLRDLQVTIQEHSSEKRVPVKLQGASLLFSSLSGQGVAVTRLSHKVTPGSRVWVDVGSDVLEPVVDEDGHWSVDVPRNASLSRRKGDIFVRVMKGNVVLYQKSNVLDEGGFVNVSVGDLPSDSRLAN